MKNRLRSIGLMTATMAIAIVNNIGFGAFDRVDAAQTDSVRKDRAPVNQISLNRQDTVTEIIANEGRTDRGWSYLFTPDYLGQKVHVRVIKGTTFRNTYVDLVNISTPNCNPNSVAATQFKLYIACNSEKSNGKDRILIYNIIGIKTSQPTLIQTITSNQFDRVMALALDQDENLWVSSYGNSKIARISRSNLKSANPAVDKALVKSPAEPVGITFDPDGSLWVASTFKGGLVANIAATDLDKTGLDIDVEPRYCISKADCNPVANAFDFPEGIALLNGTIWVSNNGGNHPGYKMTALKVVGNKLTFHKTVGSAPGSPFSCPGGLFSDGTDLYINDESFGLSSTNCGNGDDKATVNGVIRYSGGDLTSSPKVFNFTTSRPGFGGITVLKIK
jgi:hypothetical protein